MQSIRKFENFHIFLWLLKDTCWVMDFQKFGVFMIIPTISMAFFITWRSRKITTELFHNLAVCCWVTANSVWMIGEFFYDDTTRPYVTVIFAIGLLIMSYYYLFLQNKPAKSDMVINDQVENNQPARKTSVGVVEVIE